MHFVSNILPPSILSPKATGECLHQTVMSRNKHEEDMGTENMSSNGEALRTGTPQGKGEGGSGTAAVHQQWTEAQLEQAGPEQGVEAVFT